MFSWHACLVWHVVAPSVLARPRKMTGYFRSTQIQASGPRSVHCELSGLQVDRLVVDNLFEPGGVTAQLLEPISSKNGARELANACTETADAIAKQYALIGDVGKTGDGDSLDRTWLRSAKYVDGLLLGEENVNGLDAGVVLQEPCDQTSEVLVSIVRLSSRCCCSSRCQSGETNSPVDGNTLDGQVESLVDQVVSCQAPTGAYVAVEVEDIDLRVPPRPIPLLIVEDEGQSLLCKSSGSLTGMKNCGGLGAVPEGNIVLTLHWAKLGVENPLVHIRDCIVPDLVLKLRREGTEVWEVCRLLGLFGCRTH